MSQSAENQRNPEIGVAASASPSQSQSSFPREEAAFEAEAFFTSISGLKNKLQTYQEDAVSRRLNFHDDVDIGPVTISWCGVCPTAAAAHTRARCPVAHRRTFPVCGVRSYICAALLHRVFVFDVAKNPDGASLQYVTHETVEYALRLAQADLYVPRLLHLLHIYTCHIKTD